MTFFVRFRRGDILPQGQPPLQPNTTRPYPTQTHTHHRHDDNDDDDREKGMRRKALAYPCVQVEAFNVC